MKAEITKTAVDKLRPGCFISDTKINGFRARCLPSGTITFGYQYTSANGDRPYLKLGVYGNVTVDQARVSAKKFAGQVAGGENPAAEKRVKAARSTNTVGYVLDQWLSKYARGPKKLRSADAYEEIFNRHVRPHIGALAIYDVTRRDITGMLDKITDSAGPVMADRTLSHLRSAFNWWRVRDDKFETQPIVKGMTHTTMKERSRKRRLDLDEIRDIWVALDLLTEVPACFAPFVKALLLTGCRRNEVSMMDSDEMTGNVWTIPAERYKTNREHQLTLPSILTALLPRRNRDGFLFTSDGGETSFSGFSKAKAALDKKIAEIRKADGRKAMPKWQFRDLRRTVRSRMVGDLKIDDLHAKAVLGHVIPGIDGVYNVHDFQEEKAEALQRWAVYMVGLANPSANVVTFPKRRKSASPAGNRRTRVAG